METLIADREQFEVFTEYIIPPLDESEVYFISLSARNKYLAQVPVDGTGELTEREYYGLGRTEMFGRTLGYGDWEYTMGKLAANLTYRRTKTGLEYPKNAMVVYININPSNIIHANVAYSKNVMNIFGEMIHAYTNKKQPNLKQLDKCDRLLMNYIQKSTGTRHYLDVDVDGDFSIAREIIVELKNHNVKHHVVKTQGGYHILIVRESLNKSKFPLHKLVSTLNVAAKVSGGEVVFNKNAMIPMPGTLQAGKLVQLL